MLTSADEKALLKVSENIRDGLTCIGNGINNLADVMRAQHNTASMNSEMLMGIITKFFNEANLPELSDTN